MAIKTWLKWTVVGNLLRLAGRPAKNRARYYGGASGLRILTLHAMGVHIFDNCDLQAVAKKAEELERWEFLLTAAPLSVEGGTGSPLNPIATW